jgi:lipoprotein-anchoring transpeptidase ErfK/SrfK
MTIYSRRAFAGFLPLGLAACVTARDPLVPSSRGGVRQGPSIAPELAALYDEMPDERFPLPAVDFEEVNPDFLRRIVDYDGPEPVGTIIVDTPERRLRLIIEGGKALQYGVGVGKEGLALSGRAIVGRKAEWPRWTPTAAMIAREPEKNAPWAGGMEPGLENPLGARALYLYRNGKDSRYRIHGTNDPSSIGQNVSSGCVRMINQDVIDLHTRVPVGAPVIVRL